MPGKYFFKIKGQYGSICSSNIFGAHVLYDYSKEKSLVYGAYDNSSIIINDADIVVNENKLDKDIFDSLVKASSARGLHRLLSGEATVLYPLVCVNKWQTNYYHFLLETLPSLYRAYFDLMRKGLTPRAIIINEEESFVCQYLELMGIDAIIISNKDSCINCSDPFLAQIYYIDRARGEHEFFEAISRNCSIIRKLLFPTSIQMQRRSRKILIERKASGTKNKNNPRKLEPINKTNHFFRSIGFEIVCLEELSVIEQISIFASAQVIVAVHGAALANIIFCKISCVVIELVIETKHDSTFPCIAKYLGMKSFYSIKVPPYLTKGNNSPSGKVQLIENELRMSLDFNKNIKKKIVELLCVHGIE